MRAVFAIPPRPARSRRHWFHLVAVRRRFRTDFALIHALSTDLAPTILNIGIVPIIEPLHERHLATMPPGEGRIVAVVERDSGSSRMPGRDTASRGRTAARPPLAIDRYLRTNLTPTQRIQNSRGVTHRRIVPAPILIAAPRAKDTHIGTRWRWCDKSTQPDRY